MTPADVVDAAVGARSSRARRPRAERRGRDRPGGRDRPTPCVRRPRRTCSRTPRSTPRTDRPIVVAARAERDGLHVSRDGPRPGLDPGELDHLFERFYRGRDARQLSPGTGMGLAITRGLLAAAGGRVWAENVPAPARASRIVVPGRVRRSVGGLAGVARPHPRCRRRAEHPRDAVAPLLRARGYEVLTAMTGRAALEAVDRDAPDLVVLDLGLPDLDGVEVCRRSARATATPIVVLSARGAEERQGPRARRRRGRLRDQTVRDGRAAGARSASRCGASRRLPPNEPIVRGELIIDRERFRVLIDGKEEIRLTPKEFELLTYLAQHPGRVLTHRTILKAIWGPHAVDQPEHLRVLVASLRKKIEPNPAAPRYILTEPWVGYRFRRRCELRIQIARIARFASARSPAARPENRAAVPRCAGDQRAHVRLGHARARAPHAAPGSPRRRATGADRAPTPTS